MGSTTTRYAPSIIAKNLALRGTAIMILTTVRESCCYRSGERRGKAGELQELNSWHAFGPPWSRAPCKDPELVEKKYDNRARTKQKNKKSISTPSSQIDESDGSRMYPMREDHHSLVSFFVVLRIDSALQQLKIPDSNLPQ